MKKRNLKKGTKYQDMLERTKAKELLECAKCHRMTENISIDHIVPYHFVHEMGLKDVQFDHDWNFEFLCRPCNMLKGGRFDFTDPRTMVNLKRYVELAEQFYSA